MDRSRFSAHAAGNDFYVPVRRLQTAAPAVASSAPAVSVFSDATPLDYELVDIPRSKKGLGRALDFAHTYTAGTVAVMFLLIGSTATVIAGNYYSGQIIANTPVSHITHRGQPIAGLNMSLPISELDSKVQAVTNQNLTIQMGAKAETIPAATVKDWLQIVTDQKTGSAYIHVKDQNISASLKSMAEANSKSAKDQVSVTHGGVSSVVVSGSNGIKVGDTSLAAKDIAKHLLAGTGLTENVPTTDVPFNSVTPAAFTKMIEVNVVTKQMYLYDNGVITKTYPISAGAPATPTPIGQFKTQWKLPVQDMKGFNPNGTKYFQPHVRWIMYFAPGGVAVHGNYWRPTSWFGVRNSSHGCVSLPDNQAKEVYDWTPTGTTIITHT